MDYQICLTNIYLVTTDSAHVSDIKLPCQLIQVQQLQATSHVSVLIRILHSQGLITSRCFRYIDHEDQLHTGEKPTHFKTISHNHHTLPHREMMGSIPGQIKPKDLTDLILVTTSPGAQRY